MRLKCGIFAIILSKKIDNLKTVHNFVMKNSTYMNKNILFSLLFPVLSGGILCLAGEARLLRFPATNGSEIVFTYAGDLYKVPVSGGEAARLTSHVGYEMFPRFSPDGKTIAFTGQYDGNTEVYTIPASGGEPLRLTYTATNRRDDLGDRMGPNNIVMTWTPDGKKIVYRNRIGSSFVGKLKRVGKEGGLSEQIPLPEGGFCSYSPDGKHLAYNRVMREFRTWKYYKGGMADDIWIYDDAKKTVENITANDAQDIFPMWVKNEIYFLSDRDRTMNMFVYNIRTKETKKVTDFTEYDVKFPSTNGGLIVFENGGYIYKFDPQSKKAERVPVTLASDGVYARAEIKDGKEYVNSAALSPDGNRLAVIARGEIFSLPVKKGVTKNITRTPGAYERTVQWSPDGKSIAYISDITGETEIHLYHVETGTTEQLTQNNDTYISNIKWSPDNKSIVYTDRKNRLILLSLAAKQKKTLIEDPYSDLSSISFSPDSKWLTYTRRSDKDKFNVIYVYNIAANKEFAVTDHWYESTSPAFSQDGRYLIFKSMRDFNPVYGVLEWNHVYRSSNGLYLALLSEETPSPFLETDGGHAEIDENKKENTQSSVVADIRIDTEGLPDRIVQAPVQTGDYSYTYYLNGKKLYYVRGNSTYSFDFDTRKEEIVAEGASMTVGTGWKKALFTKGRGKYYVTNIPTGKADLKEEVSLSDMKISVDYPKEWRQIFEQAWRAYRDGFYVENMHGVDWNSIKAKYAVLLPYIKNRQDLSYVIGEMIGELQCGHAYITTGEMERPERIKTGLLGAEISRDKSGFFRIDKILPGVAWNRSLRSPLAEPGINVHEGEYIVAIDGIPANSVNDLYALLVGKADVPTELSVNSKPRIDGATKKVILPLEDEYPLYQHLWVQTNLKRVEKASGGKIGYIYIPDMGREGLNEFARYFYPQLDKEGLIIDDRANGGGNVSPMILERLAREPYRLTMSRGSARIGTIPNAVQIGPKVCLINKYSASDGDLFPWGFRSLGLGKLIGTRTWGGIVGISGSMPFLDGTDLRVPFFTSFDIKTGEWIIENHGVDPDIRIDNDPVREWNGEDEQLDRAIEEVMKELKNRQPLPKVPAPRIWNK
jgi:tricorn protease